MRIQSISWIWMILLMIWLLPNVSFSQDQQPRESKITLLTIAPGDDVYSVFGHSAIRVKGQNGAQDQIYNYGTFSFSQPNFLLNFLRGRLLYSLSRSNYDRFLFTYHKEQRSVYEQTLNLTPKEEDKVARALIENYKKENRDYLYEFFFDNCSTRLRDISINAYDDQLTWKFQEPRYTFRELLHQYTQSNAWLTFGIDLLVGVRTDRLATQQEEMFLPDYLYRHLNEGTTNNQPVVYSDYLVLDFDSHTEKRMARGINWPFFLFIGLFVLEVILFLVRLKNGKSPTWVKVYDKLVFTILGIGGVVLLIMWLLTDHYTTKYNWNILWLSPLYFGLLFRSKSKVIPYAIFGLFVLTIIAAFFQSFSIAVWPLIGMIGLKVCRSTMLGRNDIIS